MTTDNCLIGNHTVPKRDFAFTLTELLVVIATLAILVLMVLPVLARSDDNGARVACMHNLRQMGMAMNMYAGDNADQFAWANWDTTTVAGWLYWDEQSSSTAAIPGFSVLQQSSSTVPDPYSQTPPYKTLAPNGLLAWQSGCWFKYVNNYKSYLCPADIEGPTYYPPASQNGRANKLSSYVINGAVQNYASQSFNGKPCKITDVWSPACYLLWEADEYWGEPGNNVFNDGADLPNSNEGIARIHGANSGNVLCVGGNVEIVTVQTWTNQSVLGSGQGPGGKTFCWWAPNAKNGY